MLALWERCSAGAAGAAVAAGAAAVPEALVVVVVVAGFETVLEVAEDGEGRCPWCCKNLEVNGSCS